MGDQKSLQSTPSQCLAREVQAFALKVETNIFTERSGTSNLIRILIKVKVICIYASLIKYLIKIVIKCDDQSCDSHGPRLSILI